MASWLEAGIIWRLIHVYVYYLDRDYLRKGAIIWGLHTNISHSLAFSQHNSFLMVGFILCWLRHTEATVPIHRLEATCHLMMQLHAIPTVLVKTAPYLFTFKGRWCFIFLIATMSWNLGTMLFCFVLFGSHYLKFFMEIFYRYKMNKWLMVKVYFSDGHIDNWFECKMLLKLRGELKFKVFMRTFLNQKELFYHVCFRSHF